MAAIAGNRGGNTKIAMIRNLIFPNHDPYQNAPNLEPDLQGWNSESPLFEALVHETQPKLICEVGTWKGASAIKLAKLAPEAEVVCVDTWLGSLEFFTDPNRHAMLNLKNGRSQVYDIFLSNVVHEGLRDRVTPFPITSFIAGKVFQHHNIKFDLTYIDASHETDAVYGDVMMFSEVSNVLFGDDYNWLSVEFAVKRAAKTLDMNVEVRDEKWILRKDQS